MAYDGGLLLLLMRLDQWRCLWLLWRDRWRHGDGGHWQSPTGQVYYVYARAGQQFVIRIYSNRFAATESIRYDSFSWFPM